MHSYLTLKKHVVEIREKLKYETTHNKIKTCEKLLKTINYGYLKVDFML